MKEHRGFTLIEVIMVIVIVGIIAGLAAMIISHGVRAYSDEAARSDVHYQARLAMERMVREIRMIRSRTDIAAMTTTNLVFTDVYGNTVGFDYTAPPALRRWDGAAFNNLASSIISFAFNYYQQDLATPATGSADVMLIEITMRVQQGAEALDMRTRVFPRSL